SLEDTVVNQYDEGEEPDAVQEWLDNNPDVVKDID
ncbi:glycine/betaine ABC transporter substrate-binding protein, partial [Marinitenerispora sediminis]